MTIRGPLALLITSLAFAGEPIALQKASVSQPLCFSDFFLSAAVTPLTADLAAAARELDGIGCTFYSYVIYKVVLMSHPPDAHVFGAFNFAYSCASASE